MDDIEKGTFISSEVARIIKKLSQDPVQRAMLEDIIRQPERPVVLFAGLPISPEKYDRQKISKVVVEMNHLKQLLGIDQASLLAEFSRQIGN